MKKKHIPLAVSLGLFFLAWNNYISVREQNKQELIEARQELQTLQEDLNAIFVAARRLQERVRSGEYRPLSREEIRQDLEFEVMVAHYE